MGSNRMGESGRNRRIAPPSAVPGSPAEQAALAPSFPIAEVWGEQEDPWSRFLTVLLRALSTWPT
jgi:hypothetical protein